MLIRLKFTSLISAELCLWMISIVSLCLTTVVVVVSVVNKKNKEVLDTCKGYYEQIEKTDLIKDCKKKLCLVNYRTKTIKQMIAIVKKLQVETHLTRGELSGDKDKNPAIQALLNLRILSWEVRAVPRATNPSLYKRVRYYFLSKNYYQKCIDIGILKEPRKS